MVLFVIVDFLLRKFTYHVRDTQVNFFLIARHKFLAVRVIDAMPDTQVTGFQVQHMIMCAMTGFRAGQRSRARPDHRNIARTRNHMGARREMGMPVQDGFGPGLGNQMVKGPPVIQSFTRRHNARDGGMMDHDQACIARPAMKGAVATALETPMITIDRPISLAHGNSPAPANHGCQ